MPPPDPSEILGNIHFFDEAEDVCPQESLDYDEWLMDRYGFSVETMVAYDHFVEQYTLDWEADGGE